VAIPESVIVSYPPVRVSGPGQWNGAEGTLHEFKHLHEDRERDGPGQCDADLG